MRVAIVVVVTLFAVQIVGAEVTTQKVHPAVEVLAKQCHFCYMYVVNGSTHSVHYCQCCELPVQ